PACCWTAGFGLSNVTLPGPRYLETDVVTGWRVAAGGAPVPLVYFMSSLSQMSSGIGVETDAVFTGAVASDAAGPWNVLPLGSNLITGGVLPTAISANGLIT